MTNAFDRIKNRNTRPKVARRTDPLNDINQKSDRLEKESIDFSQEDVKTSQVQASQSTQVESDKLISNVKDINNKYLQFKTIAQSLRIQPEIKEAISDIVRGQKITKDTLIEAAIVICQQNPQIMESILAEAKRRQEFRNRAGAVKRSHTLLLDQSGE